MFRDDLYGIGDLNTYLAERRDKEEHNEYCKR
jgi:hypothetical protein